MCKKSYDIQAIDVDCIPTTFLILSGGDFCGIANDSCDRFWVG